MCPVYHPGRDGRAEERLRFATFRLPCYLWIEKSESGPHAGFGFAADLSPAGVGIYLGLHLTAEAQVRIAFESDESIAYRATVVWCQNFYFEKRFFGHDPLDKRVGLRFRFGSEAERQHYLMYYQEIGRQVVMLAPSRPQKNRA